MPIFFAYLAYGKLAEAKSRRVLVITSVIAAVVGITIGQMFYRNGELSSAGIAVLLFAFAASVLSLRIIWIVEKSRIS